jgi:hypothetical protein
MKKLVLIVFAIFINISLSYAAREDDLLEELNVLYTEIINTKDCNVILNRQNTFMNLFGEAKEYFDLREPEILNESRRLDALKAGILLNEFERKKLSLSKLQLAVCNYLHDLSVNMALQGEVGENSIKLNKAIIKGYAAASAHLRVTHIK